MAAWANLLGILLIGIGSAEIVDLVDLWCSNRYKTVPPQVVNDSQPRVSIHLPIYSEPPEVVIATLNAIGRLNYQNYEVVVIDNNTQD